MIKNGGLGRLAEAASDEDYYPVRRRGEKRRLNPNRDAIEWLENDTLDLTIENSRYLMTDLGGRRGILHVNPQDPEEDCVLVTRAYGSRLATHHKRPMFECFDINASKALTYRAPCPECDNLAYSFQGCQRHGDEEGSDCATPSPRPRTGRLRDDFIAELNRISAPAYRAPADFTLTASGSDAADGFLAAQERIIQLGEHYRAACERQAALYYTAVDGAGTVASWRVDAS